MDRYVDIHQNPKGPKDNRPTAEKIVKDEQAEGKFDGKVIFVTGGTAGLGLESARVLQETGAKVFITARSAEKGEKAVKSINDASPKSKPVEYVILDLGSLESVRKGAKDFLSRSKSLNILLNNAGVMACPEGTTTDGFETQFGTNHLGHFLLFQLLKDTLLSSSTPDFNSRVISLSSSGHRISDIHPDNYKLTGEYDPWVAYGQAKTSNILFANEIDRRYGSKGLHAWSVHPGAIMETELSRHQKDAPSEVMQKMVADPKFQDTMKSVGQGAATQVWASIAKALEGKGGKFLEDVHVAKEAESKDIPPFYPGYFSYAYNQSNAERLWADSLKFVGVDSE